MSFDEKSGLNRVFTEPTLDGAEAHRRELEPALLQRFRARTPRPAARRWGRLAIGGLIGTAALVGACQIPTEYELGLGHRIAIEIPYSAASEVGPDQLAQFIEDNYEVESIEVAARIELDTDPADDAVPSGTMVVNLDVMGQGLHIEDVWDDLLAEYPILEGSRLENEALQAHVHGTWGGRLSHRWLDVVMDEHGVEEARRQLLLDLEARGIDTESAEVTVTQSDEDGRHERRIEVRVPTQESAASDDPR